MELFEEIKKSCVKTASRFVGDGLALYNEDRRRRITDGTERLINGFLDQVAELDKAIMSDLDEIFK